MATKILHHVIGHLDGGAWSFNFSAVDEKPSSAVAAVGWSAELDAFAVTSDADDAVEGVAAAVVAAGGGDDVGWISSNCRYCGYFRLEKQKPNQPLSTADDDYGCCCCCSPRPTRQRLRRKDGSIASAF